MAWLIPFQLVIFGFYALVVFKRSGLITIDTIFAMSQMIMTVGTLLLVDGDVQTQAQYGWLVFAATSLYLGASLLFSLALPPMPSVTYRVSALPPRTGHWALWFLSATIMLAYYYTVGYSALILGVRGLVSGESVDVTTLRLESYSGSAYLFPGYVNQFKNAILPGLSVVLIVWLFSQKKRPSWFVVLTLAVVPTMGLLGTGQRGPFVIFISVILAFVYLSGRKRFVARGLSVMAVALPAMMFATLVLGRGAGGGGVLARVQGLLGEIGDRVLFSNQKSGVAGYEYTSTLPTAHGDEWLAGLMGLLPGNRGSDLSNRIFASLFGGSRGTSPPSLWGSVHYNFGNSGVVVFAVLLALVLQIVVASSLRRQHAYNSLEIMGIAGMWAIVGTWTNGGPNYLLNTGILAYLLLYLLGRRHGAAVVSQEQTKGVSASLTSTERLNRRSRLRV